MFQHAVRPIKGGGGGAEVGRGDLPTTVGSKSTKTALGTCLPAPVSLKKVLKESSPPPMVLSLGIWPSGWIPCSRQYNSQQAFPIWTPACPTWMEIHSLCQTRKNEIKSRYPVVANTMNNVSFVTHVRINATPIGFTIFQFNTFQIVNTINCFLFLFHHGKD